ncbi:MAG: glutamate racemase [Flavobacteriia bacterium]|nr:glutamate racemase [Flavobacteriia bacterium]
MNKPIGIFDSGVGGLTVAKAIRDVLPNEDVIYFGDTAHLPYGEKSPEAIRNYSMGIADFLVKSGAKAIVIACNSASSVATELLRENFEPQVPVINVIDPVIRAINPSIHDIGIIGTRATIGSGVYQDKIASIHPNVAIHALATPLLVPVIEEGLEKSEIATKTAEHYLGLPEMQKIDALIPGCTHYPLLTDLFNQILGEETVLMDTPNIVAQHVKEVLTSSNMLNGGVQEGSASFFVSDFTPTFERIARHFFRKEIQLSELDIWK